MTEDPNLPEGQIPIDAGNADEGGSPDQGQASSPTEEEAVASTAEAEGPPLAEGGESQTTRAADSAFPDEALISPDDPISPVEGDIPEDAIFPPDGPIARKEPSEGIATGMSGADDPTLRVTSGVIWEIRHTADLLRNLERTLRERGVEALQIHPDVEPMDAMLRSFIAGFLVGRLEGKK